MRINRLVLTVASEMGATEPTAFVVDYQLADDDGVPCVGVTGQWARQFTINPDPAASLADIWATALAEVKAFEGIP